MKLSYAPVPNKPLGLPPLKLYKKNIYKKISQK